MLASRAYKIVMVVCGFDDRGWHRRDVGRKSIEGSGRRNRRTSGRGAAAAVPQTTPG